MPLVAALVFVALSSCSGASTPPLSATKSPPHLAAFLRLPVATPSSCPRSVNGSTSGRRSPWVGHVDVSVFVAAGAQPATRHALRASLEAMPHVKSVYSETQREAYEEFQRLYTCSEQVPRSAVPASYRLLLAPVTRPERDALVRSIYGLPGVASVSCDPSSPCVNVKPAA